MILEQLLEDINSRIISPIMVISLILIGGILTVKTGFIQFKKLFFTLRHISSQLFKKGEKNKTSISPYEAMATALSGTIGTGNIAGVAAAVAIGGAGSIFWIWVSAFLGMATKYSEIVLAMKYRKRNKTEYSGGPMYYIEKAMGGKKLASCFAFLCLLSSFGIGNMTQSNTAAIAIKEFFLISDSTLRLSAIIIAVIIGLVIIGGIKRIAKVTSALVPAMALFYIGGCLFIIILDFKNLFDAFKTIILSAFTLESTIGGAVGFGMIQTMKVGFSKGIFTNEAGLGSAPIAHAAAQNDVPAMQGLWGIFEVFFDTIVMCTLTGLVIVLSGFYKSGNPQNLALKAFEAYLGNFAAILIAVSTVFFAIATIISWSYYGESCVKYLCSQKSKIKCNQAIALYKIIYIFAIYYGVITTANFVWGISDLLNGLMMIPNLIGVILLCNEVKEETKKL